MVVFFFRLDFLIDCDCCRLNELSPRLGIYIVEPRLFFAKGGDLVLFLGFGCFPFFLPFEALTFEFPKLSKEESVLRDDVEELLGGVERSLTNEWAPFVL